MENFIFCVVNLLMTVNKIDLSKDISKGPSLFLIIIFLTDSQQMTGCLLMMFPFFSVVDKKKLTVIYLKSGLGKINVWAMTFDYDSKKKALEVVFPL